MNPKSLIQNPFKNVSLHAEAYDWFTDRYQAIYVSRNRWLVTALSALILAGVQAAALLCLLPLKTAVPFLIKEETSGAVTTLMALTGDPKVTYDEAMRKYFLGRYVLSRETYDPTDLAENFHAVDLMSSASERQLFSQSIASNNPLSPLNMYGSQAQRHVRIRSIAFLNASTAQVRFTATEQRSSSPVKTSDWIATLAFRFGPVPSGDSERFINPLGFSVTHYRVDQEVVS